MSKDFIYNGDLYSIMQALSDLKIKNKPITVKSLMHESLSEKAVVLKGLSLLENIGILIKNVDANNELDESEAHKKEIKKTRSKKIIIKKQETAQDNDGSKETTYTVIKEIMANHLVSAAQVGIVLNDFPCFHVSEKQRELALEISTNKEVVKGLDVKNRKNLILSRNYLIGDNKNDEVYQTLSLILEAGNELLYKYLEKLVEENQDEKLKAYLEVQKEAEDVLIQYIKKQK